MNVSPLNSPITALGQVLHWPSKNTYFVTQNYSVSPGASGTLLTISTPQNVRKSLSTAVDGFKTIRVCDIFVNLQVYRDWGCASSCLPQGSTKHIHELQTTIHFRLPDHKIQMSSHTNQYEVNAQPKAQLPRKTWILHKETDL